MKIKTIKTVKGKSPFFEDEMISTVFDDDIESPLITI